MQAFSNASSGLPGGGGVSFDCESGWFGSAFGATPPLSEVPVLVVPWVVVSAVVGGFSSTEIVGSVTCSSLSSPQPAMPRAAGPRARRASRSAVERRPGIRCPRPGPTGEGRSTGSR